MLVEINRNIAAGLMTVPEGESADSAAQETAEAAPAPKRDDDIVA